MDIRVRNLYLNLNTDPVDMQIQRCVVSQMQELASVSENGQPKYHVELIQLFRDCGLLFGIFSIRNLTPEERSAFMDLEECNDAP